MIAAEEEIKIGRKQEMRFDLELQHGGLHAPGGMQRPRESAVPLLAG